MGVPENLFNLMFWSNCCVLVLFLTYSMPFCLWKKPFLNSEIQALSKELDTTSICYLVTKMLFVVQLIPVD